MRLRQTSEPGILTLPRAFSARASPLLWDPQWERLPAALYACDANGRLVGYTPLSAEAWGRQPNLNDPAERYCGAHRRYIGDHPIERDQGPMAEALRSGHPVEGARLTFERSEGSRCEVRLRVDPVRDSRGQLIGALAAFHDITDLTSQQETLAAEARHYRDVLDAVPAAIYTTDRAGRLTYFNQAAAAFSGRRPNLETDSWCVTWRLYHADGRAMPHDQCPMATALREARPVRGAEAVAERPDGTRVPFAPHPTPLRDDSGEVVGAVNTLVDLSERREAERRRRTLLDEVNHRVKNTLATVQSLARLSLHGADVPSEVCDAFVGRLMALSSVHNQLARDEWQAAELGALLRDVLASHESREAPRVRLTGPEVPVGAKTALTLALVFHELAANARRHGALSRPEGRVELTWKIDDARRLQIDWRESGGPAVRPPERRGLGSRLLEHSVARELKGQVELRFAPAGVCCALNIPLAPSPT